MIRSHLPINANDRSQTGSSSRRPWQLPLSLSLFLVVGAVTLGWVSLRWRSGFEAEHVAWEVVGLPDGKSRLLLPVGSEVSRRVVEEGVGSFHATELKWVSHNGSTVFGCIQNDIPGQVPLDRGEEILRSAARNAAREARSPILFERSVRLDNRWKGREVRLEWDGGSYAVIRYYIVDHCVYQLQAIVPRSRKTSPLIGRFLDSFRVTRLAPRLAPLPPPGRFARGVHPAAIPVASSNSIPGRRLVHPL